MMSSSAIMKKCVALILITILYLLSSQVHRIENEALYSKIKHKYQRILCWIMTAPENHEKKVSLMAYGTIFTQGDKIVCRQFT